MINIIIEEKKHGKNFIAIDLNYPNFSNIEDAKNEALMLASVLFRLSALIGKYASGVTIKIYTDYTSKKISALMLIVQNKLLIVKCYPII